MGACHLDLVIFLDASASRLGEFHRLGKAGRIFIHGVNNNWLNGFNYCSRVCRAICTKNGSKVIQYNSFHGQIIFLPNPFSSMIPRIEFFSLRLEAFWWKNEVFWSPSAIHRYLDLWCHIVFSASSQQLKALRSKWIRLELCCGFCSKDCRIFLCRSIYRCTWPKFILFHADSQLWQLSRQLVIWDPSGLYKPSI